jgi:hypothetical protein
MSTTVVVHEIFWNWCHTERENWFFVESCRMVQWCSASVYVLSWLTVVACPVGSTVFLRPDLTTCQVIWISWQCCWQRWQVTAGCVIGAWIELCMCCWCWWYFDCCNFSQCSTCCVRHLVLIVTMIYSAYATVARVFDYFTVSLCQQDVITIVCPQSPAVCPFALFSVGNKWFLSDLGLHFNFFVGAS